MNTHLKYKISIKNILISAYKQIIAAFDFIIKYIAL